MASPESEIAPISANPLAARTWREIILLIFMELESCSCAKPNDSRLIVAFFHYGIGKVDLYGPERRFPSDCNTGRNPQRHIIPDARDAGPLMATIDVAQAGAIRTRVEMAERPEIA